MSVPPWGSARATVTHRVEVPQAFVRESDDGSAGPWSLVSLDSGTTRVVTDGIDGTYSGCLFFPMGTTTGTQKNTVTEVVVQVGTPFGLVGSSTLNTRFESQASGTGYGWVPGTASFKCSSDATVSVAGGGPAGATLVETVAESASSEFRGKIDADGGATVRTGLETQTHEYHQTSELTGTGTTSVLTDVGGKDSSLAR